MCDYLKFYIAALSGAALFALAMVSPAFAADLPRPYYKALDAPAPLPAFNWQTCYAAMIAGANTGSQQTGSPVAGGLIGCNYSFGGFIVGFEGDADAAKASVAPAPGTVDLKALANASIRVAYPWHGVLNMGPINLTDALIYVKAAVPANYLQPTGSLTAGYGLAAGVEYVIRPCTTSRMEYRLNEIGGLRSHTILTGISLYYCPGPTGL
jgi:opacity protein-like surface antigen